MYVCGVEIHLSQTERVRYIIPLWTLNIRRNDRVFVKSKEYEAIQVIISVKKNVNKS